jgi:nicotinamidase-related amidase
VFTRFVPPHRAADAPGTWRRYYERWDTMTAAVLEPRLVDVLPELRRLAPDAPVFDKRTYSPWVEPALERFLRDRGADTLVVSGTETDVCVLAAVLGAVDRGFRVVVPTDAICSSADETHDALMALYHNRFGQQIETATAAEVLESWR